jgi:lipopolysaccharide export system permease protein
MSLLDRYVGRIVAGAFGAGQLFFLFLVIVMDLLNNATKYVDNLTRHGVDGFGIVVWLGQFYARMLPVLFTTITPFVTVIACMFAVARLQGANEIVPMLFVGRSTQRLLRPMLLCGACAGLGMAACWQWVVPRVGASIIEAEAQLTTQSKQKNLVHESGENPRQRLYVREFAPAERTLLGVRMLNTGVLAGDTSLFVADSAQWDEARRDWRLVRGFDRRPSSEVTGAILEVPIEWLGRPDLPPQELLKRGRESIDPDLQSYSELRETMQLRPNRPDLRLAWHRHITYPLANLILLLLALPLAVHFERGSRIERLLLAIALCGAYMLVDLTCQNLVQVGLHPVVAAWTPTIVFGSLGIVLFGGTRT